ncbi:MAG: hypothetical protein KF838_09230 [Phycisphaeraceae bacterium]|nr:MAG: hypothetical protein KF838_09230 [Phycisphaeraceae bacterium]
MSMRPAPEIQSRHDPRDEFTLLCERCGYVLEGLDHGGNCPECGKPIAESLPRNARPGSPWQAWRSPPDAACVGCGYPLEIEDDRDVCPECGTRVPEHREDVEHQRYLTRAGVKAVLTTIREMYLRPRAMLSRVRIEEGPTRSLGAMITSVASAILIVPIGCMHGWSIFVRTTWTLESALETVGVLWGMAVAGLLVLCILVFLSFIEEMGIQLFGRVHKRRITSAVAETICAHACVGWITGAVLFWGFILAAVLLGENRLALFSPIGLILGLLHFEILVWLGVKRCRYANRERPDANPIPRPESP